MANTNKVTTKLKKPDLGKTKEPIVDLTNTPDEIDTETGKRKPNWLKQRETQDRLLDADTQAKLKEKQADVIEASDSRKKNMERYGVPYDTRKAKNYRERVEPHLVEIGIMRSEGYTLNEIRQRLGFNIHSWEEYRKDFIGLQEALESGKALAGREVERALVLSATGHWVVTESTLVKNAGKEKETVEIKTEEKYFPPNTSSIQFYLSNREPDKWKKMPDVKVDNSISVDVSRQKVANIVSKVMNETGTANI